MKLFLLCPYRIILKKCFDRSSKKRNLSDQLKEGNSGDVPKKTREEKSRIKSLRK